MSDPPRATKRFKSGEAEAEEKGFYKRSEILEYQNKVLATKMAKYRKDFEAEKDQKDKLETSNSHLISWATLLSQQLLSFNDKLIASAPSGNPEELGDHNLRDSAKIIETFDLFTSNNLDKIKSHQEDSLDSIKQAGLKLVSLTDQVVGKLASSGGGGDATLQAQLERANQHSQELENQKTELQTLVNNLKQKVSELTLKAEADNEKIEILEVRAGRNLPYVIFENREFDTKQHPHECKCHVCGIEMKHIQPPADASKEEAKGTPDVEMADADVQIEATKKINEVLIESILDLQKQVFYPDQQVVESRAFNRLLKNGHQLLTAFEDQVTQIKALTKTITEKEEEFKKDLETEKSKYAQSVSELTSQLETTAIQMKVSTLEKENLQKEIQAFKAENISELKSTNSELKSVLAKSEEETKRVRDQLQEALKDKKSLSDRLNALRLEFDKSIKNPLDPTSALESQSKQIQDLISETKDYKSQVNDAYAEMESIFSVNQELESKNKLLQSNLENSGKFLQKSREENIKLHSENSKIENLVQEKEKLLGLTQEKIDSLVKKMELQGQEIEVLKKVNYGMKQRENEQEERLKGVEAQVEGYKKKNFEMKQQIEDHDGVKE